MLYRERCHQIASKWLSCCFDSLLLRASLHKIPLAPCCPVICPVSVSHALYPHFCFTTHLYSPVLSFPIGIILPSRSTNAFTCYLPSSAVYPSLLSIACNHILFLMFFLFLFPFSHLSLSFSLSLLFSSLSALCFPFIFSYSFTYSFLFSH